MVAHIALKFGIGLAPLPGGLAKERDIEQVGLIRVSDGRLSVSDLGGNQILLHRRRVNAIVEFGERAIEIPSERKALALVVFQSLKLLDQIELKLRAEPRTELEGDVPVGVCPAVTACTGHQSLPASCIDPFFCRQKKTVPACFIFNSLEFEGIKIGVVDPLPYSEKQHGVLVFQPLLDQRAASVEVPHHVGERNVVALRLGQNRDGRAHHFDGRAFGLFHGEYFEKRRSDNAKATIPQSTSIPALMPTPNDPKQEKMFRPASFLIRPDEELLSSHSIGLISQPVVFLLLERIAR